MANVTYKKHRGDKVDNLAAVQSLPAYRTRSLARAMANKLRDRGVMPSAPVKAADGWRVTAKHSGGTLSRNMH